MFNLKAIKNEFKKHGVYHTPDDLALYLKSFIDIDYTTVYDPTCGTGALLKVFDDNIVKYGQELDNNALNVACNTLVNFTGKQGDTLAEDKFINQQFDVVIANPPFSIKWSPVNDNRFNNAPCLAPESKADYAFILHCLDKIKQNGMAIILNFPGILYRGNNEGKIRKWLIDNNYIDKVISIADKKFIDTAIATCIIVLKKNKTTTDVEFIDTENNLSKIITYEEIVKNNYVLSVSNFCIKPVIKEQINPNELATQINQALIKKIRIELELNKMVYETFGHGEPLDNTIMSIDKLLNEFRRQPKFIF